MKEILSLLFIFTLYMQSIMAQVEIKGTVIDDQNLPLPGVSILVKNTFRGTMTGTDGAYNISALPSDTLVFSMVGMISQNIGVGNRTVIDVRLETETTMMDEVVVIGYGTVKKSDLTGSVSSVKTDDLLKITSLNPEQGLQGRVTGCLLYTSPSPRDRTR